MVGVVRLSDKLVVDVAIVAIRSMGLGRYLGSDVAFVAMGLVGSVSKFEAYVAFTDTATDSWSMIPGCVDCPDCPSLPLPKPKTISIDAQLVE